VVEQVFSKKPLLHHSKPNKTVSNQQRSLLLFYSAIKSDKTKKQYDTFLDEFRKYFIIKNYDKLSQIDPKKLQEMIEDYVMYDKSRNKSASYISGKVSALKLFFSMNDVVLNWVKIRKMLPEKTKPSGDTAYSTEQVQVLLKNTAYPEYKALIHFMSASGVRVGCFEELKIKDLTDMANGCKCVKVYADTRHEYFTFIHYEAVQALNEYLDSRKKNGENITDDSWVFCSPYDSTKPFLSMTITSTLGRYVKKFIGREKSKSGRYSIMSCHGLRKRFDTVLKSNRTVNISLAERLMGHSKTIPLDNSYFKPVIEQLFDEYQKAIPELIISEAERQKIIIENQKQKISKLEAKDLEIEKLKTRLDCIERLSEIVSVSKNS